MNLLSWLFVGHLIGDFLLQNNWMAMGKSTNYLPLFIHSTVYTLSTGIFAYFSGGLKFQALIIVFLSHVILDQRLFVKWWAQKITQSDDSPWLVIMIDQSWHIVVLALVSLL